MKHIVHCSGYSLAESDQYARVISQRGNVIKGKYGDWEHVCIGSPKSGVLGRIPMTVKIATLLKAECIIWSTGATFANGQSEAEIMSRHAFHYVDAENVSWLANVSMKEEKSTNTMTSLIEAAQIADEKFARENGTIYFVTSANHAPRVTRDATIAFAEARRITLAIVPAHTSYGGKNPSDVRIEDLGTKLEKSV